jgi:hypothetical protein
MVLVASQEYDLGQSGDGNLTRVVRYVDRSGTLDRTTRYVYDWRNRQTAAIGPQRACQVQGYDDQDRVVLTERREGGPEGQLLARGTTSYDYLGRVYQTLTYSVDPISGEAGNALASYTWYDAAGNVVKQMSAGAKVFTKTAYDSLGRATDTYVGFDPSEPICATGGWTAASAVQASNTILQQTDLDYDLAGNVLSSTTWSRFHDATSTGALSSSNARPGQTVSWYDGVSRLAATANYGTGLIDPTTQPTVPATSDTILVTSTAYDDAGSAFQTTDPAGRVAQQAFDSLGRVVRSIQNYVSGGTDSDQNVTVKTAYTLDGQLRELVAVNPATGDQVTRYVYGTAVADPLPEVFRNDLLRTVIYPDSTDPGVSVSFVGRGRGAGNSRRSPSSDPH